MFAVLKTGGKQYRVKSGDMLRVEKLAAEAGETIQFNDILMLGGDSPIVGAPLIGDACVQAEVVDQIKGDKVIHFVKRRRKHSSKRTKGHRQQLTLLRITEILGKGADKSGVKAAIGAGSVSGSAVVSDGQYAKNKGQQAEMKKRVSEGEAEEKSAKTNAPAKKAAPKKAAPAKASGGDDLKKLSGVGPALEKKLHENGVTSFAQIAKWSDADVAEMDEKLSFKGRIEREGWIDQAKELAKG